MTSESKSIASPTATDPAVLFLVCESGRRWTDAAKRFIGPFRHARIGGKDKQMAPDPSPVFNVQCVVADQARSTISGQNSVAILWELSRDQVAENSFRIAQIAATREDVLQLVAIEGLTPFETNTLSLRIMELGVAGVLRSPEDLATYAKLVRKRFSGPPRRRELFPNRS